jgi:hypothetical protein
MKTFLLSIAFASTAMFSGLALATQPGNNGGGNGGCGVGQQTNGCGAQGGAGGAGGNGLGVGVGVGIANAAAAANAAAVSGSTSGAAVVGSGNSNVRNTNNNANVQGQSQSSRNSNRNTAEGGRGGNAAATGGNSGGNTLTGGAVAVSVEGDTIYAPAQERAPVATAYAAPLVSSNGTCMGSSSAGGQGAALGLSFGTTWTDTNCDIRYDAEALRAAGMVDAARARLCQKAEIKDAMAAAGTPCIDKGAQRRAAVATGEGVGFAAAPQAQYQDPIIRARLGLPPLK